MSPAPHDLGAPLDDTALEHDLLAADADADADDLAADVEAIGEHVVAASTDSRGVRPQILAVATAIGVAAVIAAVLAARRRR